MLNYSVIFTSVLSLFASIFLLLYIDTSKIEGKNLEENPHLFNKPSYKKESSDISVLMKQCGLTGISQGDKIVLDDHTYFNVPKFALPLNLLYLNFWAPPDDLIKFLEGLSVKGVIVRCDTLRGKHTEIFQQLGEFCCYNFNH